MHIRFISLIALSCLVNTAVATTRYVNINSATPIAPYTSWATAATNIQDAIGAAFATDTILVTNGVYQTRAFTVSASNNRLYLVNFVTVQSVNGPEVTTIVGSTNSVSPVRCAYLEAQTTLSGFTLMNGGNSLAGGGGVYCRSPNSVVTNCIITGGRTSALGGGAFGGLLLNCVLTNNFAANGGGTASNVLVNCTLASNTSSGGGGARGSSLTNCVLVGNIVVGTGNGGAALFGTLDNCIVSNNAAGSGGGIYNCIANNSLISSNLASSAGGGAYGGTLINCTVVNNSTSSSGIGGGANSSVLNNCVLTGNAAQQGGGIAHGSANNCTIVGNIGLGSSFGGGASIAQLNNCVIYYNQAASSADSYGATLNNCCTPSFATDSVANSFTNEPLFVDPNGDFHLQSDSPCINSGNNSYITNSTDFDGNARIAGGTVDIGVYEFQSPTSLISYAWLQQYGWPTDGSADYLDNDGDGMNNWQEWVAGTDPTNALSKLQMISAIPTNTNSSAVSWQSITAKKYFLQRSGDLSTFSAIQSNIIGQAGSTVYTDTTATNSNAFFYRVGVQQ
jgi:hypothetical protein